MNRGNVKSFSEKVGAGGGLYLNGRTFDDAVRFRPLAWISPNGGVVDAFLYLEGWHEIPNPTEDEKERKKNPTLSKPIRFFDGEEIPDGINWKMSAYKNTAPRPQTPKPVISILGWVYSLKAVKCITFDNVASVKQITNLLEEKTDEGKDNESFIEDLTKVDLIARKIDDKSYSITTQSPKGDVLTDTESRKIIDQFKWNWDSFMKCGSPTEDEPYTFVDVIEAMGDEAPAKPVKPAANKPAAKPAAKREAKSEESSKSTTSSDWRKVLTPRGKELGSCDLEELKGFKETLESKGKNSGALYDAITKGVAELSGDADAGMSEADADF